MKRFLDTLFDRDGKSDLWPRFWMVLLGVYGFAILFTYDQYGVTSDEHHHVKYGVHISQWYLHFFGDYTVFQSVNTWLYGGFFDLTAYLLSFVLPLDIHDTRHLYCALIGLLGIVAAYRIGCYFGGPRAGFIAALFLVLTPRYYGHAFNNTKDIPFAVFYLWSVYYLIVGLGKLPQLGLRDCAKIGIAIGLTMAIRSSGVVLFFYMGLGFGLWYFLHRRDVVETNVMGWMKRLGVVLSVSYAVLFPFWPWLQLHPLTGLWDGVRLFASFSEVHHSFFEGHYIGSDVIPWYYALKWLLLILPEFVLVGMIFGVGWLLYWLKTKNAKWLLWALLCFSGVFPVLYAVVGGTPLYDGLRQMLFVIPPFAVVAGIGFERCASLVQSGTIRLCGWGIVLGLLLLTGWDMIAMHPNQYVYFNRAVGGGLSAASENYETDYWNHTYKQGVQWVEDHYKRFAPSERAPRIASLYPHLKAMIDSEKFDLVAPEEADFYLGNTRFDHHRAVPGEVLHTVVVQGVPLLYVIRPDSSYRHDPLFNDSAKMHDQLGDVHRAKGQVEEALLVYEEVLRRLKDHPHYAGLDSAGVLLKIGNIQLKMGREDDAMATFGRVSDQAFYAGAIGNNVGFYFITQDRHLEAIEWLKKAVLVAPNFYNPHMNLAKVYSDLRDTTRAVKVYTAAAERFDVHLDRQFKFGNYLYELEAFDEASVCFRRMMSFHRYDVRGPYYLGLTLLEKGDFAGARGAFEQAVDVDPKHVSSLRDLGILYLSAEDFEQAKEVFEKAIEIAPDNADVYAKLGLVHMKLRDMEAAIAAFDRALALDPGEPTAREYRQFLRSMLGK